MLAGLVAITILIWHICSVSEIMARLFMCVCVCGANEGNKAFKSLAWKKNGLPGTLGQLDSLYSRLRAYSLPNGTV